MSLSGSTSIHSVLALLALQFIRAVIRGKIRVGVRIRFGCIAFVGSEELCTSCEYVIRQSQNQG